MSKAVMKSYSFYTADAERYGTDEAILLFNIRFWIAHNQANEKHIHDGKCWTYNSQNAFSELFPFWSRRQIQRIIKNLKDSGAIIEGNFNKSNYDRTKWYALGDEKVPSIDPNGSIKSTKRGNQLNETVPPIPDINTDFPNTDNKHLKDIVEIISYLNKLSGKNYRSSTPNAQKLIKARLSEGFTVDDFKKVIEVKCKQWLGDKKNDRYLRPETLFCAKHFESYLNERGPSDGSKRGFTQKDSLFGF